MSVLRVASKFQPDYAKQLVLLTTASSDKEGFEAFLTLIPHGYFCFY